MTPSTVPTQEPRPITVGYRRACTLAGLVVAVTTGGMLLDLASGQADTPFWISALYPLFYFTAGWWCYIAARTSSAYDLRAWFLFAAALASYGCGEVMWGVYEAGFGINVPTPSIADIGYVACSLLLIAGVWSYTQAAGTRTFTLARMGDLGIVVAAVVLANTFIFQGQLSIARSTLMVIVQQLAAVGFATAFCIAVLALGLRVVGRKRIVLTLIALALIINVGSNFTTSFALVERSFTSTDPFNVVYYVFAALFYWAAFEHDNLPAESLSENESAGTADRALQWESLFPAFAIALILLGALIFRDVLNASTLPYISVGAIIFTVSLAFRSWWGQRTEMVLRNEAIASQDRLEQVNKELREEMETRAQVEDELRHVQKMDAVGQLTGGIAHDFNNLLAVILGNLELLQQHVAPEAEHRKMLDHTSEAAERGASLTQRLLALSRKQALNPVAIDTDRLLSNLEVLLKLTLGEKYDVDVAMNPTTWTCEADLAQLENAILNLALNARDAMPRGGELRLEACNVELDEADVATQPDVVAGSYVAIIVRDSGVGISRENLPKVFDPFFTTKDVGKGTGLGLSMVYGFVGQSGGHVRIESERGVGTSVMLYAPRSKRVPDAEEVKPEASMPRGNGESILIVEDEPAVRKMVMLMLTKLGYRVSSAENATEALSILETPVSLDLLLTDVVLPGGISGRELVRRIGRQRPKVKVLLMSGYATERLLQDGDLTESTLLLHKPFSSAQLAGMVRDAMAGGGRRQGTSKSKGHSGTETSA